MHRNVTIICSSFPPETGAAPGRMAHLANSLQQKGMKVTVITALPNYPTGSIFEGYRNQLWHRELVNGIDVYRTWLIPSNTKKKWHRAASTISYSLSLLILGLPRLLRSRPDIIIMSSPPFATGILGSVLARCSKARTILNVSDLYPLSLSELGFLQGGILYKRLQRMEQWMYRSADAVTGQSREILDHISRKVPGKRTFLYRNLQPVAGEGLSPRLPGQRKIVYAGLLGIAQGICELCKAIDFKAAGTELHLYGEGNETAAIQAFLQANPERGIYYHGSLPATAIPAILTQYHAMLIPLKKRIHGAVPSKIFNAMANGLPILFSGNGEAADIIQRTATGLVNDAGDYASLEKNITRLLSLDEAAYEQLRQNCYQSSSHEFSSRQQDELFLDFLQQV